MADAIHIDLGGFEPPELMVAILQAIDGGQIDAAIVAHLDRSRSFYIRNSTNEAGVTSLCHRQSNRRGRKLRYIALNRRVVFHR